ncbi:hypothetical protein pdam_00019221 [Pocillopora damicornis]|uniref:F5/8 type C domain-containing protein n=1 Tax=Pocillopora damicornis TaxID=46731 RepID=A0A3M6T594_POCDA|nr:hypothetical protein pdam_00019221 [Pocillopora damicornis]
MTASSLHINIYYYQTYYGRLHETREYGGWCPQNKSDRTEYLQVDMGEVRSVCGVATQGLLRLTFPAIDKEFEVFTGNSDQTSIVKHSLRNHFKARYVRFYPVTYIHWSCLRVEIFELK